LRPQFEFVSRIEEIDETIKGHAATNSNIFKDGSDPFRITVPAQSVREGNKGMNVVSQIPMAVTAAILISSSVEHRLQHQLVQMPPL
jgi:hypothetical protein